MADLVNIQPTVPRVQTLGTAAAGITLAQNLDVSNYNYFRFTLGANSLVFTIVNSREGEAREFTLALVQDTGAGRLKPTFAGTSVKADGSAGSTLVFRTLPGTGQSAGNLPTLSLSAGNVDTFKFYTTDGITYVGIISQLHAGAT